MSTICRETFRMLVAMMRFISSVHAQTNGMVERLNHTPCQMLSHLIVISGMSHCYATTAHNDSVSRDTGLAPNEVHIGAAQGCQ